MTSRLKQYLSFSQWSVDDYIPELKRRIQRADENILSIAQDTNPPTFQNTILALEYSGKDVEEISSMFFNLLSANSSPEHHDKSEEFSALLSQHGNNTLLNEDLFQRIQKVYNEENGKRDGEDKMLLEETYTSFTRNGALLSPEQKLRLRELDKEISALQIQFGNNVLQDTQKWEYLSQDPQEWEGLPEWLLAHSKVEGEAKETYRITLDAPVYIAVMKHGRHRSLREALYMGYAQRGYRDNAYNNTTILERIAWKRFQKAQLLGFKDYSEYILSNRMAGSLKAVAHLLDDLAHSAYPKAKEEIERIKALAKETGHEGEIEPWDFSFYSERLKEKTYQYSEQEIQAYLPLETVMEGLVKWTKDLWNLDLEAIEFKSYHSDVLSYEVKENGVHKALLLVDLFPRKGKRPGAWMTSYASQYKDEQGNHRPLISIVCNFTPPSEDTPSHLSFDELTTLFHEFGHALHGICAEGVYASLSGTSVKWDFVELPSQMMENWCYEPEVLATYLSKHPKTGNSLPTELIQKLQKSMQHMSGYATLRQVGLAMLDLSYHGEREEDSNFDLAKHEKNTLKPYSVLEPAENTAISPAFSHVFQGGYASGYYSYKWAEVLDADAYALFQKHGVMDTETATQFKTTILEKGGSIHPMELYKAFRGKSPDNTALKKRSGLI